MIVFIIIAIIVIAIIIWGIACNNSLISKQTDTDNAWSQIDVQLKRRNDLIPNLVSTVKGYAGFEKSTLIKVTQMRGQMVHLDPNTSGKSISRQQMINLSNQISGALKSIFAVSENYPKLQANTDFQDLMENLTTTENQIAYARQNYNDTITVYDRSLRQFPSSIIAGMRNFTQRDYLHTPESEKSVPKVSFNDLNNNLQSNSATPQQPSGSQPVNNSGNNGNNNEGQN